MMTPVAATTAHQRWAMKAPSSARNSPTKPLRPGRPIDDNITRVNTPAKTGADFWKPPISAIWRVWSRSYIQPTSKNNAPVDRPWLIIWAMPPCRPWVLSENIPNMMNPRCATDEYATRRLRSDCIVATTAP